MNSVANIVPVAYVAAIVAPAPLVPPTALSSAGITVGSAPPFTVFQITSCPTVRYNTPFTTLSRYGYATTQVDYLV